eukprot:366436-Chlamydomonas_euryale.AAC.39
MGVAAIWRRRRHRAQRLGDGGDLRAAVGGAGRERQGGGGLRGGGSGGTGLSNSVMVATCRQPA